MTIQITSTNAELNDKLNEIRFKIQIEGKISQQNKQKTRLQEKICVNSTKFHNFKTENSLNSNSNDTDKCKIEW